IDVAVVGEGGRADRDDLGIARLVAAQFFQARRRRDGDRDRTLLVVWAERGASLLEDAGDVLLGPARVACLDERRRFGAAALYRLDGARERVRAVVAVGDRLYAERRALEKADLLVDDDVVADLDGPVLEQGFQAAVVRRRRHERHDAPAVFQIRVDRLGLVLIERLLRRGDDKQRSVVRNLG